MSSSRLHNRRFLAGPLFASLISLAALCNLGAGPPLVTFRYVEDTTRKVYWGVGGKDMIGRLELTGSVVPLGLPFGPTIFSMDAGLRDPRRPRGADGSSTVEKEIVYEFRSRTLVPGFLVAPGNFVPREGGKVIAFEDYHDPEKEPRIYNLPGFFLRIENAKITRRVDPAPVLVP
jgi:hypothetical protein